MAVRFAFENRTHETINIIVEPEAVNFDLEVGKSVEVELTYEADHLNDKLDIIIENNRLIIYQNRSMIKIYVDNELKYW